MKKLAFLFVAVSAISFASCGNSTEATAEVADSDTVVCDSACCDSACCDSVVADTTVAE